MHFDNRVFKAVILLWILLWKLGREVGLRTPFRRRRRKSGVISDGHVLLGLSTLYRESVSIHSPGCTPNINAHGAASGLDVYLFSSVRLDGTFLAPSTLFGHSCGTV